MPADHQAVPAVRVSRTLQGWSICAAGLLAFCCGSLLTAWLIHTSRAKADSNRVFELMIYHTIPGKVPELESIFRDVSKLQAQHGLNVVGYWVPNDDPAWENTFIYLVAHPSRDEATKNWAALHADTAFPQYRKEAAAILEKTGTEYKVDEIYMRPTDFSTMK